MHAVMVEGKIFKGSHMSSKILIWNIVYAWPVISFNIQKLTANIYLKIFYELQNYFVQTIVVN